MYACDNNPTYIQYYACGTTHCGLAPEDLSLFFSEEVLKSTPPKPRLATGAAVVVVAAEDAKAPKVKPPPKAGCPKPETFTSI